MTIELTPERALELMREVVAEYGEDHVYVDAEGNPPRDGGDNCRYSHGDQPGCIAGHVYYRAGVTLDQLRAREGDGANSTRFTHPDHDWGLGIDLDAAEILRQAQLAQDGGHTWGRALARAEEYANLNERA